MSGKERTVLQIGPFTWPEDGEITVTNDRNHFRKT
jgi:hypothetical protein